MAQKIFDLSFDPNYYAEQLSDFGKVVLFNLIENCYNAERKKYQNMEKSMKVLKIQNSSRHFLAEKNPTETNNENNFTNFDDVIAPRIELSPDRMEATNSHSKITCHIEKSKISTISNQEENKYLEGEMVDSNISWDDMFDTELLKYPDNYSQDNGCTTTAKIDNQAVIKMDCLEVNDNRLDDIIDTNNIIVDLKENKAITKTERKNNKKHINSDIAKAISKSSTIRKVTIVKDWLKSINMVNRQESSAEANKNNLVQTQLTNKQGVMKYSLKNANAQIDQNAEKSVFNNIKDRKPNHKWENTKPKKNKGTFTVPVKSQIPVEDVEYVIVTVDENNMDEFKIDLKRANNISVAIMYENNFCELNEHYTEDDCLEVGILLMLSGEKYFRLCLKNASENTRRVLSELLATDYSLISYDAKKLINYLKKVTQYNGVIMCKIYDLIIACTLLDIEKVPNNYSELQKYLSFIPQYKILSECKIQNAAWYLSSVNKLMEKLKASLISNSLWNVYENLEIPLIPILGEMEQRGLKVDVEHLTNISGVLTTKIEEAKLKCYQYAGKEFQINSPLQLRKILYNDLKLDNKNNIKIKETLALGAKSTSELMLKYLANLHPLPKWVLQYRHVHKCYSTFIDGILHHVIGDTIKSKWNQIAAATGRIASSNPNLQAIPKTPFQTELYPKDPNKAGESMYLRSIYLARKGFQLLAADFQHIECRIFAHLSGDLSLIQLFKNTDDLFKSLAEKWMKKPLGEITSEERDRTKKIVYASMYGAGCRKLMDLLNMTYEDTLSVVSSFNSCFPSLKRFSRIVVDKCIQNGCILETVSGRRRKFKNITSNDQNLKSQAERQAINYVIQGSAADLCKIAMIMTNEELKKLRPKVNCHLVLQIHDELIWEVAEEDLLIVKEKVKTKMEDCGRNCGLSIPLPVSLKTGINWAEISQ